MINKVIDQIVKNPTCSKSVVNLKSEDFFYFDKDGFELNRAEQHFYRKMQFPIDNNILNHHSWQEPWFTIDQKQTELILDHCMILYRCNYTEYALEQLQTISKIISQAQWLCSISQKWGYDFALDAVSPNGEMFEVIHLEYDNKNYNQFIDHMANMEIQLNNVDWKDAANQILKNKQQWESLSGFAQNDWKAQYLLGWKKAEYTEKV